MQTTLYIDIIFLENLCMNYIILIATAVICKENKKIIRLLLASTLGSIYVIVNLKIEFNYYINLLLKIILSITMIYIGFNSKNIKIILKQLLIFYLVSFTFGGVTYFLLYVVKPQETLIKNGFLIGSYPIKIAVLGGVIGFIIITIAFKIIKSKISKNDMLCKIHINFNEKDKEVNALLDTGNFLKEPITGTPVIIIEKQELLEIIPKSILDNLERIITGNISQDENMYEYTSLFRIIPFMSLGKENGLLLGIKINNIKIEFNDMEKNITNAILGIYNGILSKSKKYTALIGLDLIN